MRDNDSGSEQRSGWEPPEYVSPWAPGSSATQGGDADSRPAGEPGTAGVPGPGADPERHDTIAFGPGGHDGFAQPGYAQPGGYGEPTYGQQGYPGPTAQQPQYQQGYGP